MKTLIIYLAPNIRTMYFAPFLKNFLGPLLYTSTRFLGIALFFHTLLFSQEIFFPWNKCFMIPWESTKEEPCFFQIFLHCMILCDIVSQLTTGFFVCSALFNNISSAFFVTILSIYTQYYTPPEQHRTAGANYKG